MALDQQSNWDIQMAEAFKLPIEAMSETTHVVYPPVPVLFPHQWTREILLPPEILSQILHHIPRRPSSQPLFYAFCLVSRSWYSASITRLYSNPHLDGGNFTDFVRTICPSKNAHIRVSALAGLVRRLDMTHLVHDSSKSLTARLLGRLKPNLEVFMAPQASFSLNSFAALSKCTKLKHLDLSVVSVSISHALLFQTLQSLTELKTLYFPRSSNLESTNSERTPYIFPPQLATLHLAGGIGNDFLSTHLVNAPKTLQYLSIQHCGSVLAPSLLSSLSIIGPHLTNLTIRYPMTQLGSGSLDSLLSLCTSLLTLRISADYITNAMITSLPSKQTHPLQVLELESNDTMPGAGITPGVIYEAVESGKLAMLRSVRVSLKLAWMSTERRKRDIQDLVEAMGDADMEVPLGLEVGVWPSLYHF